MTSTLTNFAPIKTSNLFSKIASVHSYSTRSSTSEHFFYQTIRVTFVAKRSQHCWAQHVAYVWPPCCDVLRYVATCWMMLDQI